MTEYLGNVDNLVVDAQVSATNIVPSQAVFRTDTDPKESSADVVLTGPYSGQHDTTVEIEILDTAGAATRPSQPTFDGVGNGTMTGVALTAVDPQSFVVTLEDVGTRTLAAYTNFQGVVLRAAVDGEDGNDILLTIDTTGLVFTPTDYALPADLQEGQNEYAGPTWDLIAPNAPTLTPEGFIPVNAPRIVIGTDPQIYRQYRKYVNGRYIHSFSPAPVRTIQKGARVRLVTGSRTITITQGAVTETLPNIVTLYDALASIRDESNLVIVDGAISNNRTPNGQGAVELSVLSESYSTGSISAGTDYVKQADFGLLVGPNAPSEELTITCYDTTRTNAEKWRVEGAVSGRLADAITGVLYDSDNYDFTIPIVDIPPTATSGSISVEFVPTSRGDDEQLPAFNAIKPRLGIAPKNGTYDFVYSNRPPELCDWRDGDMQGGPRFECLGLDPNDDVGGSLVSEESRLIRQQRITAAVRAMTEANTSPVGGVEVYDITWAEKSAAIFLDGLRTLFSSGTLNLPAWEASTVYALDDMRQPTTTNNAYRYSVSAVTGDATSGASAPTWPTTVGTTVTDGNVTWTNIGKSPVVMFDEALDDWFDELTVFSVYTPYAERVDGATPITVPAVPAGGAIYFNGLASTGTYTSSASLSAGWSLSAENYSAMARYVRTVVDADNSTTWTLVGLWNGSPTPAYYDRYRSQVRDVLAAAGIDPGFDSANGGDGCWLDFEQDAWFAYNGEERFLPIQVGHYYHLSVIDQDDDGDPYYRTMFAWGFGPQFGCAENLKTGDILRVRIAGAAGGGGYQAGDQQATGVVHSGPIEFGGGQTGTDALTWSVRGSEDGRLADYTLSLETPVAYSDGGVQFLITPGGIGFALGDEFRFDAESGQYQVSYDGGSFAGPYTIADGALVGGNGLLVAFPGGPAPSYVGGDTWTFRAEAINGPDGLRSLAERRLRWTGGTVIEVDVGSAEDVIGFLIGRHTIPSGSTITLTGSNDSFATTPYTQSVTWKSGDIWKAIDTNYTKYRLTISGDGSIDWLYLGVPPTLNTRGGAIEGGRITSKTYRLPGATTQRGLGMTVEHSFLDEPSLIVLRELLAYATENDGRRLVLVPNPVTGEVAHVRYAGDEIEVTDALNFEPTDTKFRTQSVSLEFEAE